MKAVKGGVKIDGVTVAWNLLKTAHYDEADDLSVVDHDEITLSANDAPLEDVGRALFAARQLAYARKTPLVCPHGDAWLEAVGLDEMGSVVLQIYRGADKKSAAPASQLAHLEPANYSGDPVAAASVAWMRDAARAVRDSKTLSELRDAIFALNAEPVA